ncbi:MAG: HEAT repeat domain-containing protein, partial [Bryobacteraceae bacterium]
MQVKHWIAIGIFMGVAAIPAWPQQFFVPPTPPPPAQASRADRDYQEGTAALDARQYSHAIEAFERVVAAKGSQADGAIYWIAYARNKQGRRDDALTMLAELRQTYPSSRWLNDARALDVEIRQASGQTITPASMSDEETKLMVLNGLVGTDPERIVPVLEKLLNSQNSTRVKEKALFVLAQSNSPAARNVLVQIAKGGSNPELRNKAVEY